MVAEPKTGPGGNEEGMPGLHREPAKPTKRTTEGDDHARLPLPDPPLRLLSPSRESILANGGCIHILANCPRMLERRNSSGTESVLDKHVQYLWHPDDTSVRWRTTVHSARDPRPTEVMGSPTQDNKRLQPPCEPESRNGGEIYEKDPT